MKGTQGGLCGCSVVEATAIPILLFSTTVILSTLYKVH